MHATADTLLVIFGYLAWRRVMRGVRLLVFFKPMAETCLCRQRGSLTVRRSA
jgi:hypothetical protein